MEGQMDRQTDPILWDPSGQGQGSKKWGLNYEHRPLLSNFFMKQLLFLNSNPAAKKCKNNCEEAFQDLLKSYVSFGGGLEGSNEEKMGSQQKEELLQSNERKYH